MEQLNLIEQIQREILQVLNQGKIISNSLAFAKENKVSHNEVVGCLKSLQSEDIVKLEQKSEESWVLTKDGEEYRTHGTPENRIFKLIPPQGISRDDLAFRCKDELNFDVGWSYGMKKKNFKIVQGLVHQNSDASLNEEIGFLNKISKGSEINNQEREILKTRKLVELKKIIYYSVEKGTNFSTERKAKVTDLTQSQIADPECWDNLQLKPYNFDSLGKEIDSGNLHPLLKARTQFVEVLLEMGFIEMPTNQYVESSFWNFDTLFQPQQHPARDAHDTFFVKDPATSKIPHLDYWNSIKKMHTEGGFESIGWRYPWSDTEAKKNIFRTHTTAISAKMLYNLGQQKDFKPKKYFSIDRVFRNESLDATHLAEFHQLEGVVAERNIGLPHLIAFITEFFKKIGITELKYKPTYNPYTEPSMEIFGYHPILKKWVEIGNSGVFRPEMLRPMGLPSDVGVLGWGLSLERPTMIQYGISNIRELLGYKVSVKDIKSNPICCFAK